MKREVEDVIRDSVQRLKIKKGNGHYKSALKYGMTIHRKRAGQSSSGAPQNRNLAIDLFRKLQKPNTEND